MKITNQKELLDAGDVFLSYIPEFKCTWYAYRYLIKNKYHIKCNSGFTSYSDVANKQVEIALGTPLDKQLSALVHEVRHCKDGLTMGSMDWQYLEELNKNNWDFYVASFLASEYRAWREERKALHEIKKLIPLCHSSQKLIEANTPSKLCELILTGPRMKCTRTGKIFNYIGYYRQGAKAAFQEYQKMPDHKTRTYA